MHSGDCWVQERGFGTSGASIRPLCPILGLISIDTGRRAKAGKGRAQRGVKYPQNHRNFKTDQ